MLVCISLFGHLTLRRKTSMHLLYLDQFPNQFPVNSDSSFCNRLYGIGNEVLPFSGSLNLSVDCMC